METSDKLTMWATRLHGPNKGKKYKRKFKDEASMEKAIRRYRISEAEQNMLPKARNIKYEEMARSSRRERTVRLVRKLVENKANLNPQEEIMRVIKNAISAPKLRIMAQELQAYGRNAESILAKGKAERIDKNLPSKSQNLYNKIVEVKNKHA